MLTDQRVKNKIKDFLLVDKSFTSMSYQAKNLAASPLNAESLMAFPVFILKNKNLSLTSVGSSSELCFNTGLSRGDGLGCHFAHILKIEKEEICI